MDLYLRLLTEWRSGGEGRSTRCKAGWLIRRGENNKEGAEMTLNALVCRAASVYPEAFVLQYWNMDKQQPKRNRTGGDTLAQFIAQETGGYV